MSKVDLRVDWCDHKAAKYAVEKWHYSERLPVGKMLTLGVWENSRYVGCIIFARGANLFVGDAYGLKQTEICELVRVAMTAHETPVSQIIAVCLKKLVAINPGLRLVVSYADSEQGHHGGIYQAGNWLYVGRSQGSVQFFHEGRWKHNREVTSGAFGKQRKVADYSRLTQRKTLGKHKYLYPLDRAMRKQIAPLAKPYPKREMCGPSVEGDTVGDQPTEPGSIPGGRSIHDATGKTPVLLDAS